MLRVPRSPRATEFRVYYVALVALLGFLILAVAVDWVALAVIQRVVYTGLVLLAAYTLVRAEQARRMLTAGPSNSHGWQTRYLDHVGFTTISLFDGFVIVAAIDLAAPAPAVAALAVFGVVAGIMTINTVKRRARVAAA